MTKPLLLLLAASTVLLGCATPPKPLRGDFSSVIPAQASDGERIGDTIRWGGRIVSVEPSPEHTCFEVLGRDLNASARPVAQVDESKGRFIACRAGFYDPAIFTTERDITVTGRIVDYEVRRIGEYDYRYPHVAADVIYLWPETADMRPYQYDPMWYGAYGYWGYRYPPVYIRAPKTQPRPPANPPSE